MAKNILFVSYKMYFNLSLCILYVQMLYFTKSPLNDVIFFKMRREYLLMRIGEF